MQAALEEALSTRVITVAPARGGMINYAARVDTAAGPIFVKWSEQPPRGMFEAEANGLITLAATHTLRTPAVLHTDYNFLVLEFIEAEAPGDDFSRRFAEELAALHHCTQPQFGFDSNNFLGAMSQNNKLTGDWSTFYLEQRLLPQIEHAHDRGLLSSYREDLLSHVVENLHDLLAGHRPVPSLLHGDLWSGNFLCLNDQAVVFDPAVHYGDREMELAFVELFGGFPPGFTDAYNATYPLDDGYTQRKPLHQLYPLLVHLNHFGEAYGPNVDEACVSALNVL